MSASDRPIYEELAETIAQCVYCHLQKEERLVDGTTVKLVDNMCASQFQIPTGVLNRLGILKPLDQIGRRFEFACGPPDFAALIARNKDEGCSYDTLVLALICLRRSREELLWAHPDADRIEDLLVRLGVCTTHEPSDPPDQMNWTEKYDHYARLYETWRDLL